MEDEDNHGNNQKYVDKPTTDVRQKAEKPENGDDNSDPKQHDVSLLDFQSPHDLHVPTTAISESMQPPAAGPTARAGCEGCLDKDASRRFLTPRYAALSLRVAP
ncbi:hypothetical protein QFZ60_003967 [Arthrobacter sp. B2I5]|nr:hypothetical protein [Arthrobacter sp. B2I5]